MTDRLASLFELLVALMNADGDLRYEPADADPHDLAVDTRFRPVSDLADQVFRARAELDRSIVSLERVLVQPATSTPDIMGALGRVDEAREQVRRTIKEHAPHVLVELSRSFAASLQPADQDDVTLERTAARTSQMLAALRSITLAANELERLLTLLRSRPDRGDRGSGARAATSSDTGFLVPVASGATPGSAARAGYAHCHDPDGLHLVVDAASRLSETCLRVGRTTAAIFDLLGSELPKDFAVYGLTEARLPQPETFEAAAASLQEQSRRLTEANDCLAHGGHAEPRQQAANVPKSLGELCGGLHALEHLADVCVPELIFGVVLAVTRGCELMGYAELAEEASGLTSRLVQLLHRARREVVLLRVSVDALIRAALIPPGICPDQRPGEKRTGATMPELSGWIDKLLMRPES